MGTITRQLEVDVPTATAYGWWRGLTRLPQILPEVQSVEPRASPQLIHWRVQGPAGRLVEWDAKIGEDIPNEKITWATVKDSPTEGQNFGLVRFDDHGATTGVEVSVVCRPAAEPDSEPAAPLFADPVRAVEGALEAFKRVIESPAGADAPPRRRRF